MSSTIKVQLSQYNGTDDDILHAETDVSQVVGLQSALNAKQDNINDLNTIRTNAALATTAIQNPSGGTVGDVLKKTASGTEWGTSSSGEDAKVFTLTSLSDLVTGQAILDYVLSGKYAIVYADISGTVTDKFVLSVVETNSVKFITTDPIIITADENGIAEIAKKELLLINRSGTTCTSITISQQAEIHKDFLDCNTNTTYTPTQDGNPATKKYVDDGLATKQNSLPQIVNDRFLHTNANTGELEWSESRELPEASDDGNALVSVNGAWKQQSGYGYETNVTVTWDGDTTGKRTAFFEDTEYYKISDVVLTKSQLTLPITGTWTENGVETSFTVQDEDVEVLQNRIWHAQYYLIGYFGGTSEQNGIYFPKTDSTSYVNKVTLINSVQQIDSKYIPHDSTKQDTISDLSTIRSGAALGTTSIQNPSGGSTGDVLQKTETGVAWGTVSGGTSIPTIAITMGMISAEGYIQLDETQAAYMASTDYPLIRFDMSAIPSQDYILSRMYTESAFASFRSTICGTASAQGGGVEWVSESSTVWKFVASNRRVYMDTQLMQEAITDLSTIRSGAALGATALQSVPNTYRTSAAQDVIDATKVNTTDYAPTSKTSAMTQAVGKDADGKLWTAPGGIGTESDPVFTASAAYGITSGDISSWNAKGTYSKPSGGIPSTDMTSAVQTSLGKADSAFQDGDETYYTAAEIETLWGEVTV